MSVVYWIWLISALAALGFTVGGYLWGTRQHLEARKQHEIEVERVRAQADQARADASWVGHQRDESVSRHQALFEQYKQTLAERNRAIVDRDAAAAEAEKASAGLEAAWIERDVALAERDSAVADATALRGELRKAREQLAELTRSLHAADAATKHRLTQLEEESVIHMRHIEHLSREKARLAGLAERAKGSQAALEALRGSESRQRERIAELEEDAAVRLSELGAARAEVDRLVPLAEEAETRRRESESAQRALEETRQALDESNRALEEARRVVAELPELEQIVAERDEFLLELDLMHRRLEKVDELEDRLARAASVAQAKVEVERKLEDVTKELEELRALALAAAPSTPAERTPRPRTSPDLESNGEWQGAITLEQAIAEVVASDEHRSTVVADDLGFPVVGSGIHQEPLAALCGLLADVRQRARGLLPIGQVRRITLESEHGVTVSACSDDDADMNLTLATVTAGPAQETPALRQALVNVTYALRRGQKAENRRES